MARYLGTLLFALFLREGAAACAPLTLHLPKPSEADSITAAQFQNDSLLFFIAAASHGIDSQEFERVRDGGSLKIACSSMSDEALSVLRRSQNGGDREDGGVQSSILFQLMPGPYLEGLKNSTDNWRLPSTLEELEQATRFTTFKRVVVAQSNIKRATRALFRGHFKSERGENIEIAVAQTHLSTSGDVTTPIRETEILFKRLRDDNWDFAVYASDGRLTLESEFRSGRRAPAPTVCMGCHYDQFTRRFEPILLAR